MTEHRFPAPPGFDPGDLNALHDRLAAAVPKPFSLSLDAGPGEIVLIEQGEALAGAERETLAREIAAWAPPPLYAGGRVRNAADVDRATARRIRALLASGWEDDHQMANQAMLRKVEELLAAAYVLLWKTDATQGEKDQARALLDANFAMRRDQIQAIRREGEDFKAARGW